MFNLQELFTKLIIDVMKDVKLSKTDTKTQYEAKIRSFADNLDASISEAEDKIKDVRGEARSEYQSKVNALKEKRAEVADHLVEIKQAIDNKWEDSRENFQSKFKTLSKEITDAYAGIVAGFDYLFKKMKD
jgi:SMC interacting uncharacterized protein involved in chromosome segregation